MDSAMSRDDSKALSEDSKENLDKAIEDCPEGMTDDLGEVTKLRLRAMREIERVNYASLRLTTSAQIGYTNNAYITGNIYINRLHSRHISVT